MWHVGSSSSHTPAAPFLVREVREAMPRNLGRTRLLNFGECLCFPGFINGSTSLALVLGIRNDDNRQRRFSTEWSHHKDWTHRTRMELKRLH